ncbi:MAG: glycogen debranching protein GlgX [Bacteroidota bacterium]
MSHFTATTGRSYPLGATLEKGGVNFSLFSKNATGVELLLFDAKDHRQPIQTFQLDPATNRTFHYWHIHIKGAKAGQVYAYRVDGPANLSTGHRFNAEKVLIDPYGKGVVEDTYVREKAIGPGDNCAYAMKSVVVDTSQYDWEGDQPLNHPASKTVIYEMHVGGFTKSATSGLAPELRGTYRGVIEKIPYLQELGVTSVELMPVMHFDKHDLPDPSLTNYWGYSPIAFFCPHVDFAQSNDPHEILDEFRDMVKALHAADIEVILDVVFNHTAEGDHRGPTLSFRGIENRAYYMLTPDRQYYKNYSGTGNTFNGNHSVMRRFIMDCLRYWVCELHIDGFRFDLASVLSRDERGAPIENPPILWEIESDPKLASTKLIAEAWDLGLYQLGHFVGDKWAEWNGRYRDDVRSFVKGDKFMAWNMGQRAAASQDLFRQVIRDPNRSINFVTCHDGFTMNDLVSYNYKHNLANGEDNRDGHNDNHSWNSGHEGPTKDKKINALRTKQIKNFFTLLMLSQGTPMLLMGDEVRRTQHGNNNAYCQDNEISWMNWKFTKQQKDMFSFVRQIIDFNLKMPYLQEEVFWNLNGTTEGTRIQFHGTKLFQPDWADHSHSLAYQLSNPAYDHQLYVIVNAYHDPLEFELPLPPGQPWRVRINTAANFGKDYFKWDNAPAVQQVTLQVESRSVVVLQAEQ